MLDCPAFEFYFYLYKKSEQKHHHLNVFHPDTGIIIAHVFFFEINRN